MLPRAYAPLGDPPTPRRRRLPKRPGMDWSDLQTLYDTLTAPSAAKLYQIQKRRGFPAVVLRLAYTFPLLLVTGQNVWWHVKSATLNIQSSSHKSSCPPGISNLQLLAVPLFRWPEETWTFAIPVPLFSFAIALLFIYIGNARREIPDFICYPGGATEEPTNLHRGEEPYSEAQGPGSSEGPREPEKACTEGKGIWELRSRA